MQGKKNKHITVNMQEEYYNMIDEVAKHERRTPADLIYLIVIDNIEALFLKIQADKSKGITKAKYKMSEIIN